MGKTSPSYHGTSYKGKRKCVVCGKPIESGKLSVDMTSQIKSTTRSGDHCPSCAVASENE